LTHRTPTSLPLRQVEEILLSGAEHAAIVTRLRMAGPATIKQTFGELLRDVAALANLRMHGQRFLLFGAMRDEVGKLEFADLTAADHRFGSKLEDLLAKYLDPQPRLRYTRWRVGTHDLGVLVIEDRRDAPYLIRIDAPPFTQVGDAWVRRRQRTVRMRRSELDELYTEKLSGPLFDGRLRVVFASDPPSEFIRLVAARSARLPSRVAAEKVEALIAARELAMDAASSQFTYIKRVSQARILGCDEPYVDKGVATLKMELSRSADNFRAADERYRFEQQAQGINLQITLDGDCDIECASLVLQIPANVGISIVEMGEPPANRATGNAYPQVEIARDVIRVSENYETLSAGRPISAFRQPLRVVVDAAAVGHKIPVRYQLCGRNLRFPFTGKLYMLCADR